MNRELAPPPAVPGPGPGPMVLTINGQVRELPIIAEHLLPHPPPGAGAGA